MSTKDTGGPAFPLPITRDPNGGIFDPRGYGAEGISARDYFAAHANIGNVDELTQAGGEALLQRPCPPWNIALIGCLTWWADYRAAMRYIEADAMLRARQS